MNPPKTPGIVEFHQKSVEHITMNSKRQRLDDVVAKLFIAKKSKLRQLKLTESRKKQSQVDNAKVKNTEKWRRKKQYQGPGYFQMDRKAKVQKQQEEWEKLPTIPWGGEYLLTDDLFSDDQKIALYHTCTVDNCLQIILLFYSLNINQIQRLFGSGEPLVRKISEILQLLLINDFASVKYIWLTQICALSPNPDKNVINAYTADKQLTMDPIKEMFRSNYEYSTCSSETCPLNSFDIKKR